MYSFPKFTQNCMNTATPNQGWVREDFQLPDVDLLRFFFRRVGGGRGEEGLDAAPPPGSSPGFPPVKASNRTC